MVRRQQRAASIFEMILPDGEKLWDETLRRIDEVLDNEILPDRIEEVLAARQELLLLSARHAGGGGVAASR